MSDKNYCVYSLNDPRDEQVRYIGQTRDPKNRYIAHQYTLSEATQEKREWLLGLKAQGIKPQMVIIEDGLTHSEAIERERHWIQHYRGQGHIIYNNKGAQKIQPDEVVNMLKECHELLSRLEPQTNVDWQMEKEELQSSVKAMLTELDTNYHIRPFIRYQKKQN